MTASNSKKTNVVKSKFFIATFLYFFAAAFTCRAKGSVL